MLVEAIAATLTLVHLSLSPWGVEAVIEVTPFERFDVVENVRPASGVEFVGRLVSVDELGHGVEGEVAAGRCSFVADFFFGTACCWVLSNEMATGRGVGVERSPCSVDGSFWTVI